MADPLKVISDSNGVSREEALFYLEGFNWDLNSAIEACRNKTLPPLSDEESSPEVSIDVKSATEFPYTAPRLADSAWSSDQAKSNKAFVDAIDGTTQRDAVEYLNRFNWNAVEAAAQFMVERRPTPSQRSSQVNPPANPPSNDPTELLLSLPDFKNFDPTQIGGSSSSSFFSSMEIDKTEILKDAAEGLMEVSKANVETSVYEESAETVPMAIDSRWSSSQLPSLQEPQSQLNDTLIDSFIGFVGGMTREKANACLQSNNWDINKAATKLLLHSSDGEFSEEEILAAMKMSLKESRGNQREIGSSSSSFTADQTETGSPFSEAGLVNVPVAASGIGTSQAVKNWNPAAVDEDPSIETGPDHLATQDRSITTEITFLVLLDDGRDGKEVSMTFRPDQTLRDIRDRIQEFKPDDYRDYYLTSRHGGDVYDDLNTTVQRIYSHGSKELLQVIPDS